MEYDLNLPVLDNHCHLCFPQPIEESLDDYEALFSKLGIREAALLACPVSGHNENGYDVTENLKILYLKDKMNVPVYAYAGFTEHWDDPECYHDFAEEMLAMGFDGFKSLESHPKNRKELGKGLDHPSFSAFFSLVEQQKIPMICHVGDPRPNWSADTAYEGAKELGRVYGPEYPNLEQLYGEMERVLDRYPDIPMVLAHFYFVSDEYEKACHIMERYPNVRFDLTPGGEMYVNFSKDLPRWREFFLRYRKRIIMGSDHYALGFGKSRYALARNFLEGSQPLEHRGEPVLPMNLPVEVLLDIYRNNAKALVGECPKPVDPEKALAYCSYIRKNFAGKLTEQASANLKTITEHFRKRTEATSGRE